MKTLIIAIMMLVGVEAFAGEWVRGSDGSNSYVGSYGNTVIENRYGGDNPGSSTTFYNGSSSTTFGSDGSSSITIKGRGWERTTGSDGSSSFTTK